MSDFILCVCDSFMAKGLNLLLQNMQQVETNEIHIWQFDK